MITPNCNATLVLGTHMKQFFLRLAIAATALVPVSALAADIEIQPPTDDLRPAQYDWTGFYAGAWGGVLCMDGTVNDGTGDFLNAGCGGKFGVVGGMNYQMDMFVVGVEGDYGWGTNIVENSDAGADFGYDVNGIATLRARAGIAFDRTLIFATAGGAYANGEIYGLSTNVPPHIDQDHWGWTVGGGIEHAVTDNLRLRLDYLYTDMSTETYTSGCCNIDVDWGGEHEFRVGAVWAFGSF